VHGDDAGPNALHPRADDILGCPALHEEFPGKQLVAAGMPCVDYLDLNQQATARSQHPGGVLTAQLDGSVRFISNSIDPQVWHLLHSRETPAGLLSVSSFDTHRTMPKPAPPAQTAPVDLPQTTAAITSSRPGTTAELPSQSNSLGMRFRRIPSGTFLMGRPDRGNPAPIPEDCPAHDVELSQAYWFGECEVTRDDWEKVLGTESLPPIPEGVEIAVATPEETGRLPVTAISWHESQKFCAALGQVESEQRAGRTYRLPTEAEWERACRAGSRSAYRWQPERSADDQSGAAAGISPALPLFPTGSFPPNAWGLFDLRGNAWEWTSDWYARDFYRHSPVLDPVGPTTGWFKVARGSDWRFTGEACHGDSAVLPPWKASPVIGFRLVMEQQAGVNVHP
jgi:formylglycine-generating enzyme required for sulfatase activity